MVFPVWLKPVMKLKEFWKMRTRVTRRTTIKPQLTRVHLHSVFTNRCIFWVPNCFHQENLVCFIFTSRDTTKVVYKNQIQQKTCSVVDCSPNVHLMIVDDMVWNLISRWDSSLSASWTKMQLLVNGMGWTGLQAGVKMDWDASHRCKWWTDQEATWNATWLVWFKNLIF